MGDSPAPPRQSLGGGCQNSVLPAGQQFSKDRCISTDTGKTTHHFLHSGMVRQTFPDESATTVDSPEQICTGVETQAGRLLSPGNARTHLSWGSLSESHFKGRGVRSGEIKLQGPRAGPRKALRGGISKSILQRPGHFLAINAHIMAPRTT